MGIEKLWDTNRSFPRKRLCHNTYFGETEKLKILIKEVGLEEKL
jgi:hypothetical protein